MRRSSTGASKPSRTQITEAWAAMNCCYRLTIEREMFWRLGGPPKRPDVHAPEGR